MYTPIEVVENTSEIIGIPEFFVGQSVFITGATGFLGKILLEKVLRSCFGVKKVYILIRKKRDKDVADRLTTLFSSQVFERLKEEHPNYADKVVLINGDCEKPNLGISDEDVKLLIGEISCIFHLAATVKFTEGLRIAAYINVRSVRDLMKMSKEMNQLKAFVYVSTAFSNCNREVVGEEVYEGPITADKLLSLVNLLDDDALEAVTRSICKDWPNTYVFSKAIAENLIKEEGRSLPITIVRPAIVTPTLEEPFSGWADSIYGPIGITVGVAAGVIHIMVANEKSKVEIVPADYVINHTIAAAWDVGSRHLKSTSSDLTNIDPKVLNYVSSIENPLNWSEYSKSLLDLKYELPLLVTMWYPFIIFTNSIGWYKFCSFFLHTIPGYLADGILIIIGRKPILTKIYTKVNSFAHVFQLFTSKEWKFCNDNTQDLWKRLNVCDKNMFKFDMSSFTWISKSTEVSKGGRIFIMKDPLSTLPLARKKMFVLEILHYSFIAFLLWYALKIFLFLFILIVGENNYEVAFGK